MFLFWVIITSLSNSSPSLYHHRQATHFPRANALHTQAYARARSIPTQHSRRNSFCLRHGVGDHHRHEHGFAGIIAGRAAPRGERLVTYEPLLRSHALPRATETRASGGTLRCVRDACTFSYHSFFSSVNPLGGNNVHSKMEVGGACRCCYAALVSALPRGAPASDC